MSFLAGLKVGCIAGLIGLTISYILMSLDERTLNIFKWQLKSKRYNIFLFVWYVVFVLFDVIVIIFGK